ncbi:MAG: hypothetical protein IPM38_18630 [Ignavibacteria bacterium]|nr:hypothetical protein [Ignavibacteria bacterium]
MIWTFECYPDRLVWKLNGNTVFEATDGIPTSKMYMIANVAVKDWEENNFEVDNSEIPYVMEVDYIRVYKMTPNRQLVEIIQLFITNPVIKSFRKIKSPNF